MEIRQLGNSDLSITTLGFGAWAIGGNGWSFGWGSQDDNDSIAAIHKALDFGINWIDTAAVYGLGHSEEVVARALKDRSEKPYIFTKCSLGWDENRELVRSLKAASIRREVENSLRRLQVETIDLYQIHWPNPDSEIEEGWQTLAELKAEGKVRHIGVSNFEVSQLERAQAIAPITSLQPPYSIVRREIEEQILPHVQRHNIGVIAYSPMASGLLSGKMSRERIAALPEDDWRRNSKEFSEPNLSRNLKLVELLNYIGNHYGLSAGEVAIAWTLRHPAVTAAIVGARNAEQVEGFIGAADLRLTSEELEDIDSFLNKN
ncbi:MAG: aldo/keto reductase [Chloroflexota bacterium]|nr:aldo/keto reductase [Chloroflexota bacterium]